MFKKPRKSYQARESRRPRKNPKFGESSQAEKARESTSVIAVPESSERPGSSIGLERIGTLGDAKRPKTSARPAETSEIPEKLERLGLSSSHESYLDYLMSIKDKWPEYQELHDWFEKGAGPIPAIFGWQVFIHISDVLLNGSFAHPHNFECNPYGMPDDIKQALLERSTNVRTRIVLYYSRAGPVHTLLNLIGLAFDIEPSFFWSLINPTSPVPRQADFLTMGSMSIKILTNVSKTSVPLSFGKLSCSDMSNFIKNNLNISFC